MKKLNQQERKQLQRELINIWRAAGSPALDDFESRGIYQLAPYDIQNLRQVQQTYGLASKLKISLSGHDITPLVAKLSSLRLCKDGSVNIRAGICFEHDEHRLATAADRVLLNAAIGCFDLKAMAAMNKDVAEKFYNKLCVAPLQNVVVQVVKRGATHE